MHGKRLVELSLKTLPDYEALFGSLERRLPLRNREAPT